jgi:hypothetical protein
MLQLDPVYLKKMAIETAADWETRIEVAKSIAKSLPYDDPGPAPVPEPPPVPPPPPCVNMITVELGQRSTAGLQVSQLTAGGDTYALTVGVGASETVAELCVPPDCEEKTATVTIVDANNNHVATLGGFPVCKCAL